LTGPEPAELVGVWEIERDVADLRGGGEGTFTGTLTVAPDGAGFSWVEDGTLRWGDYTGPAGRTLRFAPRDGAWWLCFADGRPFHPWTFDAELVHPCAADVYRGRITRHERDLLIDWDVTGPAKRQRIRSRLRRRPS
jgi:hypothetical protein